MFEVGLNRDANSKIVWDSIKIDKCITGCIILTIGCFYFTYLKGDCRK